MRALFISAFTAALVATAAASASTYTYMTIAAPNAAATFVEGFNNHGAVVGEYQPIGGSIFALHGFILSNGQYQTIDPPGSADTFMVGISDDGTIFGGFVVAFGGAPFAFTYKNGTYTILGQDSVSTHFRAVSSDGLAYGDSVDKSTSAERLFSQKNLVTRSLGMTRDTCTFTGVNDDAVSTGTCAPSYGANTQPFSFHAGMRTRIVIPFGDAIKPRGINNAGTIVGYYRDTRVSALRGFIDKEGAITVVADPDRRKTAIYGVNDVGDVVGVGSDHQFYDSSNDPFICSNGVFTHLQPPASPGNTVSAIRINAAGQILGTVSYQSQADTGFLATPVP